MFALMLERAIKDWTVWSCMNLKRSTLQTEPSAPWDHSEFSSEDQNTIWRFNGLLSCIFPFLYMNIEKNQQNVAWFDGPSDTNMNSYPNEGHTSEIPSQEEFLGWVLFWCLHLTISSNICLFKFLQEERQKTGILISIWIALAWFCLSSTIHIFFLTLDLFVWSLYNPLVSLPHWLTLSIFLLFILNHSKKENLFWFHLASCYFVLSKLHCTSESDKVCFLSDYCTIL